MSKETMYTVTANPLANKGDDYAFSAVLQTASFNTRDGDKGASLKCERDGKLIEAFGKLNSAQRTDLLFELTTLKLEAELSKTAAGDLSSGLFYYAKKDPIGKACKQAGF